MIIEQFNRLNSLVRDLGWAMKNNNNWGNGLDGGHFSNSIQMNGNFVEKRIIKIVSRGGHGFRRWQKRDR